MLTKYMQCVRYNLILKCTKLDLNTILDLLDDEELLINVLKLYDVKIDDVAKPFDEVRKIYNNVVLDHNWAEKMYNIERCHWLWIAQVMQGETF